MAFLDFLKRPSRRGWFVIHVCVPLFPFVLGGLTRFGTTSLRLSWTTFSASELAISLGLLSIFISQSLSNTDRVLDSEEKKEDTAIAALLFVLLSMVLSSLFVLIEGFGTAVDELDVKQLESPLRVFRAVVFLLLPVVSCFSIRVQGSFKLKASLF